MLSIKLRPAGKKHQRTFRVVVAERRSKLNGRFVAELGWIDPHSDSFHVNKEEAKKWIGFGAQPTDSVHNLFVKAGVLEGPKVPVHSTKQKKQSAAEASEEKKAPAEGGEGKEEPKAEEQAPAEEKKESSPEPEAAPPEEPETQETEEEKKPTSE